MNNRRKILVALGAGAFSAPLVCFAQQSAKVFRIGFLGSGPASIYTDRMPALRTALRELGYVEGKNLIMVFRYQDGEYERLSSLAAEIVALNPDVIVASATPAIRAAQQATKTIPIVMSPVTDPVGSGFVASLAKPGGNITGVANMTVDISAKSLELLHSVVPKAGRIAVLMSNNPSHPAQFKEVQDAAKALSLIVISFGVTDPSQFERTSSLVSNSKCQALLVLGDPMLISLRQQIAEFAAKARLPAIYQTSMHVEAGGLISYGPSSPELFRMAASYVDKILRGANPATTPVEQPTKFEMVVNLKTAKALSINIPQSILVLADKVIE